MFGIFAIKHKQGRGRWVLALCKMQRLHAEESLIKILGCQGGPISWQIGREITNFVEYIVYGRVLSSKLHASQARIQRGGGGTGVRNPPPPPWDFPETGSCVEAWWVGEGVQRLFSLYYYLRSPVLYKRITYIHTFKFNIQYGTVILSLYSITLILMERIQLTIPCCHERASSYFSCLKLHDFTPFKTKIFCGRTPWPPPRHIYNIKLPCHLCVYVERGLQLYKRPCPTEKKPLVCR